LCVRFGLQADPTHHNLSLATGLIFRVRLILQQDRANFHKFNRRDKADSSDGGFFASAANRAKLAKHADGLTGIDPEVAESILKGNVTIRIDSLVEEGEDYMLYEIVK